MFYYHIKSFFQTYIREVFVIFNSSAYFIGELLSEKVYIDFKIVTIGLFVSELLFQVRIIAVDGISMNIFPWELIQLLS